MYKIAISGKANSGKNTTASLILEELSLLLNKIVLSKTIAFADPIKEIILTMFPSAKKEYLFGPSSARAELIPGANNQAGNPLTYRQALIDIGTLARQYKPSIWVDCFDKNVKALEENNKNLPPDLKIEAIIVPDLRFFEEFDYLINNNYFLIKLNRKDYTAINHQSETEQDAFFNFNYVLDNNGTLSQLRDKIKNELIPMLSNQNH